jgi:thioredoxin-related protein
MEHKKYSNKGLVILGLNPYDNKEKTKKKLSAFLDNNNMNYPIVFIEKEIVKDYKVRAFPTFYIIDKKGKIAHSQVGFGESTVSEIDSIINVLIK